MQHRHEHVQLESCPALAAMPTATSLPMTCTATMVTRLALGGVDLAGHDGASRARSPGCGSRPGRSAGRTASQRTSLAIFIRSAARAFSAPWAKTSSSLLVRAWNLLGAVTKCCPVSGETASRAPPQSKPARGVEARAHGGAAQRQLRAGPAAPASSMSLSPPPAWPRQPLISWEKRDGRRVLQVGAARSSPRPRFPASSRRKVARSAASIAGSSRSSRSTAPRRCAWRWGRCRWRLWDMFTWSLGCSSLFARQLVAAVGDDLVDVHVGLGAASGLPDHQREVLVQRARRSPRRRPPRSPPSFSSVIFSAADCGWPCAAAFFKTPKAWTISAGMRLRADARSSHGSAGSARPSSGRPAPEFRPWSPVRCVCSLSPPQCIAYFATLPGRCGATPSSFFVLPVEV